MPLLTLEDIKVEVSRFTYRPGWTFEVWQPDQLQGPVLSIRASVPNSYDPYENGDVELKIHSHMPPFQYHWQLREWLAWRLRQIEIHESMEWLKYDGKCLNDPHKDIP